jgi:AcrR family transcriptional regulator
LGTAQVLLAFAGVARRTIPEAEPAPAGGAGGVPYQRAAARRNAARVLAAARRLVADRGFADVTMAAVARAAGVSRNTVLNHVGDRAGLARALLDDHERGLQDALLDGPPPLGPGADAEERLVAFLQALAAHTDAHRDLLAEVDGAAPAGWYRTGAYAAWRLHLAALLGELGMTADPAALADVLLAALAPDFVVHWRTDEGRSREELTALLVGLARAYVSGAKNGVET